MEPTNNPIQMPNPDLGAPVPPANPVNPVNPAAAAAPAAPVMPEAPVAPVAPEPVAPVMPEALVAPVAPEPVAPVASEPVAPAQPVAPVFTPGAPNPMMSNPMISATDPVTMPEAPVAPDPVEEELKAPFTPAAPVPGSIGSAVSVPADAAPAADAMNTFSNNSDMPRTPSVSFTDPATQENPMTNSSFPGAAPKPKMSKTTLILLCVVAVMAVIALAIVLFTMMG